MTESNSKPKSATWLRWPIGLALWALYGSAVLLSPLFGKAGRELNKLAAWALSRIEQL